VVIGLSAQSVKGTADLRRGTAVSGQEGHEQPFLDIVVAVPVRPVPEVAIAQLVPEQGNDPALRSPFGFSNVAHMSRVLPVRSSRIMPCLIWRAFAHLASSAAISASISLRMLAIAVSSAFVDGWAT